MLRQWHYRGHYFANVTDKEELHLVLNAEHCLDMLLQAAMCHAAGSLVTFAWDKAEEKSVLNTTDSPTTCVDWGCLPHLSVSGLSLDTRCADCRIPCYLLRDLYRYRFSKIQIQLIPNSFSNTTMVYISETVYKGSASYLLAPHK